MKKTDKIVNANIQVAVRRVNSGRADSDRDALIERMGCKEKHLKNIPVYIDNYVETVINPWFIYKMEGEAGIPRDILQIDLDFDNDWSDWCEFWLNSFKKISHKILLDTKAYNKALKA